MMKRISVFACLLIFCFACNSSNTETPEKAEAAPSEQIDYAYLPSNHPPDNWDRGDQKNVELALKSLKAWENGNIDECLTYFGDSVHLVSSEMDESFSNDSLKTLLKQFRSELDSYKIHMADYESVISKDKKDEYVGLWYKEVMKYKDGKIDSLFHMDDIKIENGKIVELDEKTRRFPVK